MTRPEQEGRRIAEEHYELQHRTGCTRAALRLTLFMLWVVGVGALCSSF